jgi:amino acid transporter
MGEEDVLPAALGRAHRTHKTPHVAIAVIAPVVGLVPVLLVATGTAAFNVIGYVGTLGTFGYMLGYLLMAAALPFFLRRRGEANPLSTVLSVVVVAALLYVFFKNVWPVPPSPYNLLPWIFLGVLVVGLAWYFSVRARNPEVLAEVGMMEEQPIPPGTVQDGGRARDLPGTSGDRPRGPDAGRGV